MNRNIKHISIPQPCTQNWADMDVADEGWFCQNCQKNVVDFTGLTNNQIVEVLSSLGNTCGRFANGQLERVNAGLMPPQKISSFSWTRFSIAAAFIGFVPFIKAEAQVKPSVSIAPILNKPDTLSARQVGIKSESIKDQLKKDAIEVAFINPELEDSLTGLVGGITVTTVVCCNIISLSQT